MHNRYRNERETVIYNACPADIDVVSTEQLANGNWNVLSSGGGTVRCWPVAAKNIAISPHYTYGKVEKYAALSLVSFPDRREILVARSTEGSLIWWDRRLEGHTGIEIAHPALKSKPSRRASLAVVSAEKEVLAVTNSMDGGLRRWRMPSGELDGDQFGTIAGNVRLVIPGTLPDGMPIVVTDGSDGLIHRWDPVSAREYGNPISGCGGVASMAVVRLSDGRHVVCVLSTKGNLHRRDLLTGETVGKRISTGWQPSTSEKACRGFMAAVDTNNGAVLATSDDRITIRLWDLVSGALIEELSPFWPYEVRGLSAALLPSGTPVFVAGDSSGQMCYFGARDGVIQGMPVWPHGNAPDAVVTTAGGDNIFLSVKGNCGIRSFNGRTGEPVGGRWRTWGYSFSASSLSEDRILLAVANGEGIAVRNLLSGIEYRLRDSVTIWDVAIAHTDNGGAVVAGAGHDSLVHRWDAWTGEIIGEPLNGHKASVKAVTVANQIDGTPMFVTGCEQGVVLRWDAASGESIGSSIAGPREWGISDLDVADLEDGRQILVGLDRNFLYQWNPLTGEAIGDPVEIGDSSRIVAVHTDQEGLTSAFVWIYGGDTGKTGDAVQVSLGSEARIIRRWPSSLRAVFSVDGVARMVFGESDGSLVITDLLIVAEKTPMSTAPALVISRF